MTQPEILVNILRGTALLAWAVFIAWYWIRARWWQTRTGRNIMGVAFAIFALLALIAAQTLWPDFELRRAAQVFIYGGITALAIQRTAQMERAQRRGDAPAQVETRAARPR